MKRAVLFLTLVALLGSGQALADTLSMVTPDDGDTVNANGFPVVAKVLFFQDGDDLTLVASLHNVTNGEQYYVYAHVKVGEDVSPDNYPPSDCVEFVNPKDGAKVNGNKFPIVVRMAEADYCLLPGEQGVVALHIHNNTTGESSAETVQVVAR